MTNNLKYGPYSPSRLDVAACPYSFYRQYVDPDRPPRPPENLPQARGGAMHEVFEKMTELFKQKIYAIPKNKINDWVVAAVKAHPAAYQEIRLINEMADKYLLNPPKVLTEDADVELRMAVKLTPEGIVKCSYEDPQAFARGRADIMMISDDTTEAFVYDHKTQPNIEDADTFQLGFYAWVISKEFPFLDRIKTVLHFSRYGYYSEPYVWTKEDLLEVEREIFTKIGFIESYEGPISNWPATSNKHCQYCPFIKECPNFVDLFEFNEAGNLSTKRYLSLHEGGTAQAVKFAGYINTLDELLKSLKDDLKEFVGLYGAVAIPGKVYEYRSSEGVNWDAVNKKLKNKAYEVFEKYGIDPKMFMGFSTTFSNGVWILENKALLEDLSKLFPRKVSVEFRGKKT